jgi:hypothetical protein
MIITWHLQLVGAVETEQSRARVEWAVATGLYTTRIRFAGQTWVIIFTALPNSHLLLMGRQERTLLPNQLYQTCFSRSLQESSNASCCKTKGKQVSGHATIQEDNLRPKTKSTDMTHVTVTFSVLMGSFVEAS